MDSTAALLCRHSLYEATEQGTSCRETETPYYTARDRDRGGPQRQEQSRHEAPVDTGPLSQGEGTDRTGVPGALYRPPTCGALQVNTDIIQ